MGSVRFVSYWTYSDGFAPDPASYFMAGNLTCFLVPGPRPWCRKDFRELDYPSRFQFTAENTEALNATQLLHVASIKQPAMLYRANTKRNQEQEGQEKHFQRSWRGGTEQLRQTHGRRLLRGAAKEKVLTPAMVKLQEGKERWRGARGWTRDQRWEPWG